MTSAYNWEDEEKELPPHEDAKPSLTARFEAPEADWRPSASRRFQEFKTVAWEVIQVAVCFAVTCACVTAQAWVNYDQTVQWGLPWVIASVLSALGGPWALNSILSRNPTRIERLLMAVVLVFAVAFDLFNNAANQAATSDTQRAEARGSAAAQESAETKRERLNKAINEQIKIVGHEAVGTIEIDIAENRKERAKAWRAYTQDRTHRPRLAPPPSIADLDNTLTSLNRKLAAAKERDARMADLNEVQDVVAKPAPAHSAIIAAQHALSWLGAKRVDPNDKAAVEAEYNNTASAVSWGRGGFMLFICIFMPWVANVMMFKTLSPGLAERKRLEKVRDMASRKAAREARRTTKNAIWGRRRRRAEAWVKARFQKKPPLIVPKPAPEPRPKQPFEDMFGRDMDDVITDAEPPLKVVPEAPQDAVCNDPALNAIINSGLQRTPGQRFSTKEFYEKVWKPWHEERGHPAGKQTGMTNRLLATGLFEKWPGGGYGTWIADWSIRARNERPRFRVVS